MANFNVRPTASEIEAGKRSLQENEYPGRVLIMGLGSAGCVAIQAYALTGRSKGSRNRIFVPTGAGGKDIRVEAPDMTPEQMSAVEKAELIYYKAMADNGGIFVVSNGAQTEPILEGMLYGRRMASAVREASTVDGVDLSMYEPDAPNYTPRITGVIKNDDIAKTQFGLSVVRRNPRTNAPVYSNYWAPNFRDFEPGIGFGIQTYKGDGDPLPSFDQQPYAFPIAETAAETADGLWRVLNKANRVAVVVRSIDLLSEQVEICTIH